MEKQEQLRRFDPWAIEGLPALNTEWTLGVQTTLLLYQEVSWLTPQDQFLSLLESLSSFSKALNDCVSIIYYDHYVCVCVK